MQKNDVVQLYTMEKRCVLTFALFDVKVSSPTAPWTRAVLPRPGIWHHMDLRRRLISSSWIARRRRHRLSTSDVPDDAWALAREFDLTDPSTVARKSQPKTIPIDVLSFRSGLHGTTSWDSARMLQSYIDACEGGALSSERLGGCRVVELGSGCGVAGMAFALRGAHVTFTDKEDMMAHCRSNVARNLENTPHWQRVHFAPFLWGTDPRVALEPPYDLVLATDPFVLDETCNAFVHALRSVSGRHSLIVIVFQVRSQDVFAHLLDSLTAGGFEWEQVNARRLARACVAVGYSGIWCPMLLARRAPGMQTPASLDVTELPSLEVSVASAAAEPNFMRMQSDRREGP